jgi:hypothetical protein
METAVKNEGEYLQVCNDLKKQYDDIKDEYQEKLRKKDEKIKQLREKYDKDMLIKQKRIVLLNQKIKITSSEMSFYRNCYDESLRFMNKLFLFFNKSLPDTHSILFTDNKDTNFVNFQIELEDESRGIKVKIDDYSSFFHEIPKLRSWFESII